MALRKESATGSAEACKKNFKQIHQYDSFLLKLGKFEIEGTVQDVYKYCSRRWWMPMSATRNVVGILSVSKKFCLVSNSTERER